MPIILAIALGGACGAVGRHFSSAFIARLLSPLMQLQSPLHSLVGTFFVNVLGSLLIGVAVGFLSRTLPHSEAMRAFLVVGFLGGFTTFSAFSLQMVNLYEQGHVMTMSLYGVASVIGCMLATFVGLWLMRGSLV